jgi:hypothetical protein
MFILQVKSNKALIPSGLIKALKKYITICGYNHFSVFILAGLV